MSTPIVEARGLTKSFGKVQALAGLDLVAESGQVVAVLGPNGAGKTTFVRSVATLVRPDGGELRVAGIDATTHPEQVRRVIGLAGQYAAVEPAMTGRENVTMVARLYGQTRRQARSNTSVVLDQLGLADAADRPVAPTRAACAAGSISAPAAAAAMPAKKADRTTRPSMAAALGSFARDRRAGGARRRGTADCNRHGVRVRAPLPGAPLPRAGGGARPGRRGTASAPRCSTRSRATPTSPRSRACSPTRPSRS